jgi:hypothetical protein
MPIAAAYTETVLDWVRAHPMPDGRIISVCLWGPRGVGKTAWVRGYTRQRNIGFRGYHPAHDTSGADIVGLPMLDEVLERTVYARPLWLPAANDPVVFERTGVLFIDELNRAPLAVLQGLLEPIGEGSIEHSGWRCPPGWGFVCAANPPGEGYAVSNLDAALMDRMVHIPMGFDAVRWTAWAGSADIHPDLVTFTALNAPMMADHDISLPTTLDIGPTPWAIEYLSRLYEPGMNRQLLNTISQGLIGREATESLLAHIDTDERPVSADEVLSGQLTRLGAHRASGRDDLLEASQTLVLAMMVRYTVSPEAAQLVSRYMQMLGRERASAMWEAMLGQAPHWAPELREAVAQPASATSAGVS